MAEIYIAFVDTPGFFAGIIRRVIKQKYIHVALSLDPYLEETYSIGRRHPSVPLIAGFEKEDKYKILRAFPDADYMICRIRCTTEQKKYIEQELNRAMEQRFSYHYTILGLPFILMNIPFYQKNHYTCSSYLARLLEQAGVCRWDKHFSLVTPKDFYEYDEKEKIFEGSLYEFTARGRRRTERKRLPAFSFMQPAHAGAAYIINFLKRGVNL
ncbi:hypothetical protein QVN96_07835 [Mediterraneibacter glycyrrhizinilyticus]|uniref:hypothetical protein n=1 Tax=Mediterraneibacter glycyrrhizinilyticus TaxID=342942 RepID=UPI0025AB14BD|nr:hypothetical protein [Mediterraneibacter glycyrrhizinilyticus]MDN0061317.1 hypothetical protein [Mediterraneibacter glycyrrhizinilyticus]